MNYNQLVARNIRRYRQERAFTLGDLSRRAGLSKQTVSKIEQGVGNPTVETLALLSAALEVSPQRLLTEWGTPVFVQHADEGEWVTEGDRSERLLDEIYGSGHVRNSILRLIGLGTTSGSVGAQVPGTLHHVYVMEGRLQTGPVSDPVDLVPGDFVRYPGDVPHRHVCLSERVVAHVVTTLPQLRQFEPIARPRPQVAAINTTAAAAPSADRMRE